jgi:hypothetical protein
VTGGWRKLHDEGPHDLYSYPSITHIMIKRRRTTWAGYVAGMWKRNAYRPKGRRQLVRSRRMWVDNIKLDKMLGSS